LGSLKGLVLCLAVQRNEAHQEGELLPKLRVDSMAVEQEHLMALLRGLRLLGLAVQAALCGLSLLLLLEQTVLAALEPRVASVDSTPVKVRSLVEEAAADL